MEIIRKQKWLRLVRNAGRYRVQVKYWFKWRDVTFGPYWPMSLGITDFTHFDIINEEFEKCLVNKKSYSLRGIK